MTNTKLAILVIDGCADYADEVQQNLERQTKRSVEVVFEPDLREAVKKMADRHFNVVLAKREILDNKEFPTANLMRQQQSHSIVGMLESRDGKFDAGLTERQLNWNKNRFLDRGKDEVHGGTQDKKTDEVHDGIRAGEKDGDGDAILLEPINKLSDFLVRMPVQPDVLTQLILSNIEKFELKASLQSTEKDLRKIIEKNADSILVVDANGALLYWNAAAQRLFRSSGLVTGEVFGIPLIAGETTELDVVDKSGERIVAEMRVVDIEWSGQAACLASLRDVTQRKLTEELLEAKVKDRTKQLEELNQELRKMYESAENAARVRSQFIANFSHEVRTPLGGIVAASEMLPMADDLEEFRELASSVADSSKQLLSLVESILDFSKLESGAVPVADSDFSLRELFDSVVQSLTKLAAENSTSVTYILADTIPDIVQADAVKIRQVILNLTHNAIKFTKNGYVEIRAELQDSYEQPTLRVTIKDSGIGMTARECETIFQPFVQGNRKIHGRFGGTGLGLSICKQLVEAMHGTINFYSEPEKGSTFWFAIPIKLK
ncbi:MAG: PAS domain S-box protein [Candidatus Melainabacteria bacterium]|nr:MAG: PAS domain S-box protein [Candidatus Melainabacteria bacterium]